MLESAEYARLRLVDKKELKELVGLSDAHILRLEKAGKFPRRIQVADNTVRWRIGVILDWIDSREKITPKAHLTNQEGEA